MLVTTTFWINFILRRKSPVQIIGLHSIDKSMQNFYGKMLRYASVISSTCSRSRFNPRITLVQWNVIMCANSTLPWAHSNITFVTKKSGKFHFWMATAPGTNMLSTNFWLIIVHPVRVKTYRSLKIKFFVKVKNKVQVTIGHVCDFAGNYGPAQNDFKVKILWCVMEFCIEQYTDDGQYIYKQFHILRMKFYRQDFFWSNILFGHVFDILV